MAAKWHEVCKRQGSTGKRFSSSSFLGKVKGQVKALLDTCSSQLFASFRQGDAAVEVNDIQVPEVENGRQMRRILIW